MINCHNSKYIIITMYPELINSYLAFCQIRNESYRTGKIDLSDREWFYPTTLLPLGDHIKKNKQNIKYIPPTRSSVNNYIEIMVDSLDPLSYDGQSFVPLINLPKNDTTKANKLLCGLYHENEWIIVGGKEAYTWVINELVDNIYQHSEFNNAAVMAQRYERKKFIELCFFDNGISIPGSYNKHLGREFNGIEAIREAINGLSTKHEKGRGTGLADSIKLVSRGMKGEVMVVSDDGIFYKNQSDIDWYILKDEINKLNGTLISIRIPFQKKEVLWYEYLK